MDANLRKALVGTAGALQQLAFESGVEQLREFDLKSCLRRCLQTQIERRVVAEPSGSAPGGFKGVSTVDLVVPNPRSDMWQGALELKWWSGKAKVREGLWDAYKLAALYQEGRTENGYLVAAGPEQLWNEPMAGLLTEERTWPTREFVTGSEKAFDELIRKGPDQLPAGLRTRPVGEVSFLVSYEQQWWLRAARIRTMAGAPYSIVRNP